MNYLQHVLENLRTVAAVFQGGYIPKVIEFRKNLGMESLEIPMVGAKLGSQTFCFDMGVNPKIGLPQNGW